MPSHIDAADSATEVVTAWVPPASYLEPGAPWVSADELQPHLGISPRFARRLRSEGLIKPGHDFYVLDKQGRGLRYSVPRVREVLLARAKDLQVETYSEEVAQ